MSSERARHVVLVGLMGSGKSTVGRRLARLLDRAFTDADSAIEEREQRSIAELFEADGEAGFRRIEHEVLAALLDRPEPTVIAAGGGVVLLDENRRLLSRDDLTVVWLDADPALLASRARETAQRPLLSGEASPRQVLERLHAERGPLYAEVADVALAVDPFHGEGEASKRALAARLAELVEAHEAGVEA